MEKETRWEHPILGTPEGEELTIYYKGTPLVGYAGQSIAAILMDHGIRAFRKTRKYGEPRGIFCGIGQCTDCVMVVDGVSGVKTCVTPARDGMRIEEIGTEA